LSRDAYLALKNILVIVEIPLKKSRRIKPVRALALARITVKAIIYLRHIGLPRIIKPGG
jgi:hypothetical protein